jgi:hypothetical protein
MNNQQHSISQSQQGYKNILISAKPLVFKKKNITKISELVMKNKKRDDEEQNDEHDDDSYDNLTEEFFEKYFSCIKLNDKHASIKDTINNQTPLEDSDIYLQSSPNKTVRKGSYKNQTELNSPNKKDKENKILTIRDHLEQHITSLVTLPKPKKKTMQYKEYISTIIISNCNIDSVKHIHIDIADLLQEYAASSIKNANIIASINNIQLVDLSFNKLKYIDEDIALLPNLKIMKLNNNELNDLNKIRNLGKIKTLVSLNLTNNGICKIKGYRQFIIEMCEVLQQLDSAEVTEKELEVIHFGGSKFGEVRENGNGKVIKYPTKKKYNKKNF